MLYCFKKLKGINELILHLIKPLLHKSPVYPGLHPVSHLPVILLHMTSPKQCPLQLYMQSDPNVRVGHSEKKSN